MYRKIYLNINDHNHYIYSSAQQIYYCNNCSDCHQSGCDCHQSKNRGHSIQSSMQEECTSKHWPTFTPNWIRYRSTYPIREPVNIIHIINTLMSFKLCNLVCHSGHIFNACIHIYFIDIYHFLHCSPFFTNLVFVVYFVHVVNLMFVYIYTPLFIHCAFANLIVSFYCTWC